MKPLQKLLAGLGRSTSAKDTIASACFAALAAIERQPPSTQVSELLSQRLLRVAPDSLEANLTTAKHLLAIGKSTTALD